MSTYFYDFDGPAHGCNLEIEIEYEVTKGETHVADQRSYTEPGRIELIAVSVTAIEGYDSEGEIVYRLRKSEIDPDWLCDLERLAMMWVEEQIDLFDYFAEELWENA